MYQDCPHERCAKGGHEIDLRNCRYIQQSKTIQHGTTRPGQFVRRGAARQNPEERGRVDQYLPEIELRMHLPNFRISLHPFSSGQSAMAYLLTLHAHRPPLTVRPRCQPDIPRGVPNQPPY